MKRKISPELEHFSSLVGDFIEYWGFKKVHGRVWALLFVSGKPMDAAEIAKALDLSAGLTSMTLNTLVDYGVIEVGSLERRGGKKSVRLYEALADPVPAVLGVLRVREARLLATIAASQELAERQAPTDVDPERIHYLKGFIACGQWALEQVNAVGPALVNRFAKKPRPKKPKSPPP